MFPFHYFVKLVTICILILKTGEMFGTNAQCKLSCITFAVHCGPD